VRGWSEDYPWRKGTPHFNEVKISGRDGELEKCQCHYYSDDTSQSVASCLKPVMRNRCAAEAIQVCHEIFTSHYNYNHNEINNCLSCFLLCLSFHFIYYSRADRGQTRSTKWNWNVTHPSPPPPTICKMGLVCRHDSSTIFSVPRV
jgi:hypothetical protein